MGWLNKTALVLANIGAINWGLTAMGWNAVENLIGSWATSVGSNIVYALVAVSGIWGLVQLFNKKKR